MNRRICSVALIIVVGTFLALGVHQVADRMISKAYAEPANNAKPAHIDDYVSFDKKPKSIRSKRDSDDEVDLFTSDPFRADDFAAISPDDVWGSPSIRRKQPLAIGQSSIIQFRNGKIYIPVNVTRYITAESGERRSVVEQHSQQLTGARKEYFDSMVKSMMLMSDEELAEATKTTKKQIDDKTALQRLNNSLFNLKQIVEQFPETPAAEMTKEILALPNVVELLKTVPGDISSEELIDFSDQEFPTIETDNVFDDDFPSDPAS